MKNNINIININSSHKSVYLVGKNLLADLQNCLADYLSLDKVILLIDKTVFSHFGRKIKIRPIVITLPGKEEGKNFKYIPEIMTRMLSEKLTKDTVLIALGGGSVTDAGGFIASVLLRGIKLVFIPTTLLAMVDAAIGGKNGFNIKVNGQLIKNMLGTFYQPDLVLSDIKLLETLPDREMKNGFGEIIKYHLAFGKPDLNVIPSPPAGEAGAVEGSRLDSELLAKLISQCQNLKLTVVKKDPFDKFKKREVLNLGHTVGHAVESVGKGRFSHGEAVAIGLAAVAKISAELGLLKTSQLNNIISLISFFDLPVKASGLLPSELIKVMEFDKKAGRLVLLKDIGKTVITDNIPHSVINKVLKEIT